MFSSLRRISYILDIIGVVNLISLINIGFKLYNLVDPNTKELLALYFMHLGIVPVVIFTVSILFKKVINEMVSESISLNKRISGLEKIERHNNQF